MTTEWYADPNSGSASQPGGAAVSHDENGDIIVNKDGELEAVDGNDVTSKATELKQEEHIKGDLNEEQQAEAQKNADKALADAQKDAESDDSDDAESDDEDASEAFDPSGKSVADIKAYIEAHPDEKDAVLAAEASGKNRPTVAAL